MPLLGLLDWIVIALLALVIEAGIICFCLAMLHEWISFKPEIYWRPSTHIVLDLPEEEWECRKHRYVEAPRNYNEAVYNRGQKLKWYHQIIFDL
jgi:hypothetical protein